VAFIKPIVAEAFWPQSSPELAQPYKLKPKILKRKIQIKIKCFFSFLQLFASKVFENHSSLDNDIFFKRFSH
jgi:hypothetical protein